MESSDNNEASSKDPEEPSTPLDKDEETPDTVASDSSLHVVEWDGPEDPQKPLNWSRARKLYVSATISSCTFIVTFGSSVISSAVDVLSKQYHVSPTVMTLSISLYVVGFAAGPLVWAPIGDVVGHRRPLIAGYVAFMCFTVGVATAQNLYTLLICRFMQGTWGAATFTLVPGMIVAMWSADWRLVGMISWAGTIVLGPTMGPVVGGFTTKNASLGWRWTMWITLIISALFLIPLLFIPETWSPLLLQRKAHKLRRETKIWALHAKLDEQATDFEHLLRIYGLKPMQMLFREPILAAVTLFNAFVYAVLYLLFEAFPYSFGVERGWQSGISGLPFLSVTVGAGLGYVAVFTSHRLTLAKKRRGYQPVPEDTLPPMIIGSFLLVIGLFWFAWTSYPTITWIPQVLSESFIGAGYFMVFVACQVYIMECYLANANSALAANAMMRSALAAGFPLFATQMFQNLGVPWASSLLGFLAIALTPFPIIFYVYGKKIRSWSRFAY